MKVVLLAGYPLTIATTLIWGSPTAKALSLTAATGTWSNVVGAGATLVFQTVDGENQIRWGETTPPSSSIDNKSGLGFTGVSSANFAIGDTFAVGTLRHFNRTITLIPDGVATAADLTVNLAFSNPAISPTFNFNLSINETVNNGPCPIGSPPCPDVIGISNALASETFTVNGTDYALELLGFQTATGQILSQFISEENGVSNSATLFARITAPPPPVEVPEPTDVPEPATVTGISLLGLLAIGQLALRQFASRGHRQPD
jgi:hypothetical protein